MSLPKTKQPPPITDTLLSSLIRNRFQARNYRESFGYACEGLVILFRTQRNFRTHIVISVLVLAAGLLVGLSPVEWLPIVLVSGMMFAVEALNTAIEFAVDLYTQGEFDMRAKTIKDISAAACLLTAACAVVTGLLVFCNHFYSRM